MGRRCSPVNWWPALILLIVVSLPVRAADVCAPTDIHGPYGFQLSGTTTISGKETPLASMGRLVFDGKTSISGVSSVNFHGLFLGNPVTGSYEIKTDCTLTLSLQDDSGAFQHFTGKASPGANRAEFHQSDPNISSKGLLVRLSETCDASGFHGQYNFTMSGTSTPLATDGTAGITSAKAVVLADGAGGLSIMRGDSKSSGTYTVDSDCFLQADFGLADGDNSTLVKLRGIVVNGGKEVLAVGTDPERVANVRFSQ